MKTPNYAAAPAVRPVSPRRQTLAPISGPNMRPMPKPVMRKYEISYAMPDETARHSSHIAPATADFEQAFSAFARGTLIETDNGPCAIEDLIPGTFIKTADGTLHPLMWVGSMTMVPSNLGGPAEKPHLTRILADTFGLSSPMIDLIVGPGARLLRSPAALREFSIHTKVLTPAHLFVDAMNVIETSPQSPVALYHICLAQHAIIYASGIEVETYHPGQSMLGEMRHNMKSLFMSLFPHLNDAADFGALSHPRAGQAIIRTLSAA